MREDVQKLVETVMSDSWSFPDVTPVTSGGLGQFVLSLGRIDGSNHYVDGCVPLDSFEPLFAPCSSTAASHRWRILLLR